MTDKFSTLAALAYAYGVPAVSATIKQQLNDFIVDEELGFNCTGNGEHLYLRVQKSDLSTPDVARRLQAVTDLPLVAIGYTGMKDRRGECSQWFSLPLEASAEYKIKGIEDANLAILETQRNSRKLKIGSHKRNHFQLRLRDCEGDPAQFDARLRQIQISGLPNYFGEQRFGRDLSNLAQVQALMEQVVGSAENSGPAATDLQHQHFKRGMLYSAARAYLFNQVLSSRIEAGNWNTYTPGDVLNLAGTDRCFAVAAGAWDEQLQRRLQEFDVHLTGPLAGAVDPKDKYISHGKVADIEDAVLRQYAVLVQGLKRCGLNSARRPLRFVPIQLEWHWETATVLSLRFALSRGSYATSLLRELCNVNSSNQ